MAPATYVTTQDKRAVKMKEQILTKLIKTSDGKSVLIIIEYTNIIHWS